LFSLIIALAIPVRHSCPSGSGRAKQCAERDPSTQELGDGVVGVD
jgi:hypothetical protein